MNKMQEKFQITPKNEKPEDTQWADFNKQRIIRHTKDTRERVEFAEYGGPGSFKMSHNNEMPPGYDIDAAHGEVSKFGKIYLAGTQDATDNPTNRDLVNGFVKSRMSPVEDMYTDEHRDDFYDSVDIDGVEGFVERANYLDRL